MQRIDDTSVTRQQKLKLFKVSICPHLTWDLSILDLPVSWLWNTLQPITTRYLKRWSGLSRSVDPNCLFLPKSNDGLDLPHLLTVYKKIQATKAGSHMFSRDSSVRAIATLDTLQEASLQHILFQPHQEVVKVMRENPGASRKCVVSQVKANIQTVDTAALLAHHQPACARTDCQGV